MQNYTVDNFVKCIFRHIEALYKMAKTLNGVDPTYTFETLAGRMVSLFNLYHNTDGSVKLGYARIFHGEYLC